MMEESLLRTYLTNRQKFDASILASADITQFASGDTDILAYSGEHANISVQGILTPDGPDLIDRIVGNKGTSYKAIISALYEADEELDSKDSAIFLQVNSPGGDINGAEATAAAVADVASRRPVIAVNGGIMASAALWISSGAHHIMSNGRSTLTGSIGAIATVVDHTGGDIKIHNFVNPESPNKAPDPSTDEGAQAYIDMVSGIYSIFRDDLISGRNGRTDVKRIESLRGAVVTAEKAMEVGLIDSIVNQGPHNLYTLAKGAGEDGSVSAETQRTEEEMNLKDLLKEHPEAKAELDAQVLQARSEGEKAAMDRQAKLVAQLKPFMDGQYPERVKTACADAISGIRSVDSVLDLIAIFDEIKASADAKNSDEEQEVMPETPSAGPEIKTRVDDAVSRDAQWNESIKALLG